MSNLPIDYSSVRYAQEYFDPTFASTRNGGMSVSETYFLLAIGILDPSSFSPMRIFKHNYSLYCIDTRRLKTAKELQDRGKFDVLNRLPIQYIEKDDTDFGNQYRNLVHQRLPAMRRKGLDGSTIKVREETDYMCCYEPDSDQFRDDLEEHIIWDHLDMSILDFRRLHRFQCSPCKHESRIIIKKPAKKGHYKFIEKSISQQSKEIVLHTTEKSWDRISLKEIRKILVELKNNVHTEQRCQYRTTWNRPPSSIVRLRFGNNSSKGKYIANKS